MSHCLHGPGDGLSSIRCQANTRTYADLLVSKPLQEILSEYHIFFQENTFENIISKKASILSRAQ